MRSVEVSAKTRQEAIGIALEQLGVDRDEAHVEIVDEGSSGIFGFGARPVKLRVSTEVAGPEPRPQRSERSAPRSRSRSASREKAPAHKAPAPKRERAKAPSDSHIDGEAAALLNEVINLMGIEASVTSESTENGGICLKIDSPDSAILIGRKGRNLSSMQYLLNRMVHTGEGEESERIVIDIEGYLDRRQDALEEMARRQAERAKETRRRVRLKPMSPQERRVVHMALENDPDVKTFSVGEATVRSVIIAPADELPEEEQRNSRRRGGSRRGGGDRDRQHATQDSSNGENRSRRRGSRRGGRGRRRRGPSGPREENKAMAESSESASSESNDS